MAEKIDKLVQYMIALNEHADLLAKHQQDPQAAAEAFGLDKHDIKLILDENDDKIIKRVEKAGIDSADVKVIATHTP